MNTSPRHPDAPAPARAEHASLLLVRHGRTTLNAAGQLRGRLDPALDEVGLTQVQDLAEALRAYGPRLVVSSPLRRALQTAEAIAEASRVGLVIDGDLVDREYGRWAGHSPDELEQQWGSVDSAPGVETWPWLSHRAVRALEGDYPSEPVVLVTHEAVLQAMLEHLEPEHPRPRQDPACWNVVVRDETGHLRLTAANRRASDAVTTTA